MKTLSSLFIGLLILYSAAPAQEFRGTITGQVLDPSGAAVPGAKVQVRNVETNTLTNAATNGEGVYNALFLLPGRYALTVTLDGFKTAIREGIEIRVGDKLTVDITLELGLTQTLVVSEEAPMLESSSVSTGQVVDSRQITELPLAEGTAYVLATLAPGIEYTGNPQFSGPTANGNLSSFRSNGGTGPNQITLDGSPNFGFTGFTAFSPPAEAVSEFKVQTNDFDAQNGYTAGATVNVALKSGTNKPHGALYYLNRDTSRVANNFFSNRNGQPRPERSYHRFGGTMNGPVFLPKLYDGRDKTFFLFSYEGINNREPEPNLFTVPTEANRRGDFTSQIAQNIAIYDPLTAALNGTLVERQPFAGNLIPASRIDKVAGNVMRFYPIPNATGRADGTQNFFSPQSRSLNYDSWLIRLDHNLNSGHRLFGKYYRSFATEDRYDWAGRINDIDVTRGFEYRTNNGANLDYTGTLTPTTVLDVRSSLNEFQQQRRPAMEFDPAQLGFTPEALAPMRGYTYLPRFDMRNFSTIGAQRADYKMGLTRPFYMGSLQPTVTMLKGKHTLKFGYDLRLLRENYIDQGGRFYFDGLYTTRASNSTANERNAVGRDLAAFLVGIGSANSNSLIDNPTSYNLQSIYQGFFVQNDWRVNSRLTVNLGLRYELELGNTERYNRMVLGFDSVSANPIEPAAKAAYATNPIPEVPPDQFKVKGGYLFAGPDNRSLWAPDRGNFSPRAGAAYRLNNKTILRGGFGLFTAPFQVADIDQTGFSLPTLFAPSNNNGLAFQATISNPFPNGVAPSPGSSQGLATNLGRDVGTMAPLVRYNPRFARTVVGVQRELPSQFVLEGNFVYSRGGDLAATRTLNFTPAKYLSTSKVYDPAVNTFLTGLVPNPFRNLLPGTSFNGATIARSRLLVSFPQFGSLSNTEYNGSNTYRALQMQIQKRFSKSLTLMGSFTWASLRERTSYLNPQDIEFENRIAADNRPHRLTFAGVYQLPIGRGRPFGSKMSRLADAFAGGWQVNGTLEWQRGEPLRLGNVYYGADLSQLAARVGSRDPQGRKYGIDVPAFETSGFYFSDEPVMTNGNVDPAKQRADARIRVGSTTLRYVPNAMSNFRNQSFLNSNLSLSKNVNLGESMRLQVRIEAINFLNHPYFSGLQLDPTNASFGYVNAQRNLPRDIQLGGRFTF